MKAMKELSNLKSEALESRLLELQKELMKLRSQVASGTIPKSSGKIRLIKKTIARINTINTRRKTQRNE
ncbi:50S ribosomal protein L29 [Candidatus Woesearchaeota archaeon]|nr:50S ribosomal protein L29 [Candidatus Woesearchaeota archaeon]